MDDKRTEWVSVRMTPEDAKRYKDNSDNYKIQMEIIDEFFVKEKKSLKYDLEQLDGQVLEYRTILLKTRQSLQEAMTEHAKKAEEFWDEIWRSVPSFREKVKSLAEIIRPVVDDVKSLSAAVKGVETYDLEKLTRVVQQFSSMGPKEMEMFKLLVDTYKK